MNLDFEGAEMTRALRERIAKLLGWTVADTEGFSVQVLRELILGKGDWKLEYELARVIQTGAYIFKED